MASARVETIQPTPPPKKVILELTEDEGAVITLLVGNISGVGSARSIADGIYFALSSFYSRPRPNSPAIPVSTFPDELPRLIK